MYYNFKSEDLSSEERIEHYKQFAKEVFANMQAVRETYIKLKELVPTASMKSKIGNLEYEGIEQLKTSEYSVFASGRFFSADRLRQDIFASLRGQSVAINTRYQEGTGEKNDPLIDVAAICYEYNSKTGEIKMGEVLTTEDYIKMRQELREKSTKEQTPTNPGGDEMDL